MPARDTVRAPSAPASSTPRAVCPSSASPGASSSANTGTHTKPERPSGVLRVSRCRGRPAGNSRDRNSSRGRVVSGTPAIRARSPGDGR